MCRKTLPKWTSQIRISSSEGVDGLDDGHSWRKYGQKEILGAKYPRLPFKASSSSSSSTLSSLGAHSRPLFAEATSDALTATPSDVSP